MLKRIISLSLIIVMMVSLAGCKLPKATSVDTQTNTNNTESVTSKQAEKERVIEEAKAYLQANYPDDVFTYVSGRSPNWAYRYYELGFSSEKYDGQTVIVYGDPRKDDNPNSVVTSYYKDDLGRVIYDYFDTYYQYTMKKDVEDYIEKLVGRYINDVSYIDIIFYDNLVSAKSIDNTLTATENMENGNINILISLRTEENLDGRKDDILQLSNDLIERNIYTSLCIRYKQGTDDYSGIIEYRTYNSQIKEVEHNE